MQLKARERKRTSYDKSNLIAFCKLSLNEEEIYPESKHKDWKRYELVYNSWPDNYWAAILAYHLTFGSGNHECIYLTRKMTNSNGQEINMKLILLCLKEAQESYFSIFSQSCLT